MYHEYHIQPLSRTTLTKLSRGHPIRIKKHHSGHKIHLTKEQLDKLEKAFANKKGSMVQFSESQIKHNSGKGLFDSLRALAKKHRDVLNPVIRSVKNAGHHLIKKGSSHLHSKVEAIPEIGEGIKRRRGRPRKLHGKGEGIVSDVLGAIGKVAGIAGLGVKHRKPRGKGLMTDIAKAGAKALIPALVDVAGNAVKSKVSGMGAKRRGRPRKTTTTTTKRRYHKKSIKGSALFPAGIGGGIYM